MSMPRWLPAAAVMVMAIAAVAAAGYLMRTAADDDDVAEVVATPVEPSIGVSGTEPAMARNRRRTPRCDECGTVESIRTVTVIDGATDVVEARKGTAASRTSRPVSAVTSPRRKLEIVIRLQDGTTRIVTDVDSARWKQGERVKVISGLAP